MHWKLEKPIWSGKHNRKMASNRDDSLSYTNNLSLPCSPITASDLLEPYYLPDPSSSLFGSASNSYQNDSVLLIDPTTCSGSDAEFGFSRPDFRQSPLAGTVQLYHRHVFLCYKNPSVWPARIEAAEFDRLPRLLSAAVMARKGDMKNEVCFSVSFLKWVAFIF